MTVSRTHLLLYLLLINPVAGEAQPSNEPPQYQARIVQRFASTDAYQGIAVDDRYFYAINNRQVSKHDKLTGAAVGRWDKAGELDAPLMHLDSGVVIDGELIAAHSNYPGWPMRSSLETFDTADLTFTGRHDFGVMLGSMTWLDKFNGVWWGAFANYDILRVGALEPYGGTRNTVIVSFDGQFNVAQQWRLPPGIIARVSPMSNSGGSWGEDGYLYLTGHDYPEIYVMQAPADTDTLHWVATVQVPGLNGQGIAWDRSTDDHTLWGILRAERQVLKIRMPQIRPD